MKLELKSYDQTPKDPRNGEFGANHELVTASVIYISCVKSTPGIKHFKNISFATYTYLLFIVYFSITSWICPPFESTSTDFILGQPIYSYGISGTSLS